MANFVAIRKPDSRRLVYKTYVFIINNLYFAKNGKQKKKIFNMALTPGTIFAEKCWFFAKKGGNYVCVCTYLPNFKFLA